MSIKTEESLNCPCNGIYMCGLHSIPKFLMRSINARESFDRIIEGAEPYPEWEPTHISNLQSNKYD